MDMFVLHNTIEQSTQYRFKTTRLITLLPRRLHRRARLCDVGGVAEVECGPDFSAEQQLEYLYHWTGYTVTCTVTTYNTCFPLLVLQRKQGVIECPLLHLPIQPATFRRPAAHSPQASY
jgi:hypothetical protein